MTRLAGNILTPQGFVSGTIEFSEDGRVARIEGSAIESAAAREGDSIILPGFIDQHVHGGAGHDIMEGGDAARHITAIHARHGTTSLLATTMTAPAEDLTQAFAALSPICKAKTTEGARVLGVHLEGPYINSGMLGAQPDFARPLSAEEIARLHAMAPIRLITLAPEVPGTLQAIAGLVAQGFKVQIGHTTGSYEDGLAAMKEGATSFTHLYNAMTGMHHRKPGMAGAALAHAEYAEIIPDLLHVHPGAIRVALRSVPKLFCVTDSTAAAGMPDGEYRLGRQTVQKCMGAVRLADGTLAGSTLTMDQAFRNLVDSLGLDLMEASHRTATYAADHLGIQDRGRLQAGAFADALVLDRDLVLREIFIEGKPFASAP